MHKTLKDILSEKHVSIEKLARILEIDPSQVDNLISGKYHVNTFHESKMIHMADYLDITPKELRDSVRDNYDPGVADTRIDITDMDKQQQIDYLSGFSWALLPDDSLKRFVSMAESYQFLLTLHQV